MIALVFAASALLKLIYASLIAGVGVAVVFSLAILGVTRSNELRRANRTGQAAAYGVLGAVGLLLSAAIVAYGLFLVAHKGH